MSEEQPEVNSNDISDAFVTGGCYTGSNKLIARMPTERHAAEYNMKHKNRGQALIFNHESFEITSLKSRSGTEEDCKRLYASLKNLHFDVQVHKDKKLKEIEYIIKEASLVDHTDSDCILIAILSHGEMGYIYAKDTQYKLDSIAHCFTAQNCKSLAGKPKLFFIQACQGDRLDSGITLEKTETDGESSMSYRIPVHADFLIAYSTIPASLVDHTDSDCILIAILSHGEMGYIYAKDTQYKLDSIAHCFTAQNCKSLAGKPKLFFIQACQGDRLDSGITLEKTETDGESSMSYRIPVHADFLIAYSTIPGFYSWRNTTKGSWFMQSLCKELDDNGKNYDILTLLTFVCQRVAFDFESCTPDLPMMHQQKQIPCTTTMLTRILKFSDKK